MPCTGGKKSHLRPRRPDLEGGMVMCLAFNMVSAGAPQTDVRKLWPANQICPWPPTLELVYWNQTPLTHLQTGYSAFQHRHSRVEQLKQITYPPTLKYVLSWTLRSTSEGWSMNLWVLCLEAAIEGVAVGTSVSEGRKGESQNGTRGFWCVLMNQGRLKQQLSTQSSKRRAKIPSKP